MNAKKYALKNENLHPMKTLLTALILFNLSSPAFAEPCVPLQPFSNVMDFDRLANGQLLSLHDCDQDGLEDYRTLWTVVEFLSMPLACTDPYDSRHLIIPLAGFYRVLAEPAAVFRSAVELPRDERGDP